MAITWALTCVTAVLAMLRSHSMREGKRVRIVRRNRGTPDGINVESADYVVIDGFIVNDMPRVGVRGGLCSHADDPRNPCRTQRLRGESLPHTATTRSRRQRGLGIR